MMLIDYGLFFFTAAAIKLLLDKLTITDLIYDLINDTFSKFGESSQYNILLGHSKTLSRRNITLNLKLFPSLSITGISGSGKTKMVEYILKHTSLKILLINAYKDDYSDLECLRINNITEIETFLDKALEGLNKEPLLVVFDECLSLLSYKNISKKLHTLLTKNRHMDLYVICIFQELNKTIVPFKSLFTARVVLRQIQQSDVNSALGTTLEEYKSLKNREFILLSDDIYEGKTFFV